MQSTHPHFISLDANTTTKMIFLSIYVCHSIKVKDDEQLGTPAIICHSHD